MVSSYNGWYTERKHWNNGIESHKHTVERKKPETKEHMLYESIYMKFKPRKSFNTFGVKARLWLLLEKREPVIGCKQERNFWGACMFS